MDKILVVDLCNTIYKSNTTQDFFSYVFKSDERYKKIKRKNSNIGFKIVNKLSNKILKYDMSRALITKILKDKTDIEIENLVSNFINEFLEQKKITGVHDLISDYKNKGYKVIIMSASYGFIVKAVVEKLSLDGYISSEAEIIDKKFTGKVSSDILYTKFKVFKSKYVDYTNLIMITDNETDYDFVKKTDKSYIVINNNNKMFWKNKKEDKFIFLEE